MHFCIFHHIDEALDDTGEEEREEEGEVEVEGEEEEEEEEEVKEEEMEAPQRYARLRRGAAVWLRRAAICVFNVVCCWCCEISGDEI